MPVQYKHFLNSPASLVLYSIEGLCAVNPNLCFDRRTKTVYLGSHDRSKVALLCGGGSGHEPAHAGFVGRGMLTAAICGNVFASPTASQVRRGIELVDNEKGTLIIVKNYTGDVLNFGLAKEQFSALHPEKTGRVKFVIVGDDVAVGRTQGSIVGRRGLAGTVLVYKIAGALADQGASLDEVYNAAQWVASNLVTIGVGLDHCHVPGTAETSSYLKDNEIEIGMGIHNESGHRRISPIPPLNELIPQLLEMLTSTSDPERSFLPFKGKDEVVALVNNLGGLSELEMGGVVSEVHTALLSRGITVQRVLSGSFMTSLNMPGFSITLLLLPISGQDVPLPTSTLLSLLDAPTETPNWKWSSRLPPRAEVATAPPSAETSTTPTSPVKFEVSNPEMLKIKVEKACKALISAEPEITRMDTIAGDGDCGLTLKAGAEGVLKRLLVEGSITGEDLVHTCITVAQVAEEVMGGTSGALYSIFFSALAQGIQQSHTDPIATSIILTTQDWSNALTFALTKLYTYTRARPPSRTLVDPLAAFIETLKDGESSGAGVAVKSAVEAAEKTREVDATAGRSAYVEGERLKEQKVPDPGAWGVKVILESLVG